MSYGRSEWTRLLAQGREAGSWWEPGSGKELGLTLSTTHPIKPCVAGAQRGAGAHSGNGSLLFGGGL